MQAGVAPRSPPPPALGRTEGVPTCGWIAFALCLLGNGICRGHETRGLQWLCTELARGEKKAKQTKPWVIGVSPGAGDPTAVTPARRTLPRPSQRHRKLLVLQSPSCSSCAAVFFGTGCAWSQQVRGPQRHPACPVPWPSRAPKDFAPGSEDVTTATTGRAQRRCQVWRGSIRRSPGKPPEDTHPYPGHPSLPRTPIPMWNIHPVPGYPSQPGTSIPAQVIHLNLGRPSQPRTSIPIWDIHPNPGHPSRPRTSIPARHVWLYNWDQQRPEQAERTAPLLLGAAVPIPCRTPGSQTST